MSNTQLESAIEAAWDTRADITPATGHFIANRYRRRDKRELGK